MTVHAKLKTLSFTILAALFLSACSTVEGIGKDIQKGGQAIERAAERASK